MTDPAIHQLWEELGALHARLRTRVEMRGTEHALLRVAAVAGRCITTVEIDLAMARLEARALAAREPPAEGPVWTSSIASVPVRERAARDGRTLPLDALALAPWERAAVVLCAAVELDEAYGRLFSFLRDEPDARSPTAPLLATLLADDEDTRTVIVRGLGPFGSLCRRGIVRVGDDRALQLHPLALELLLGGSVEIAALFRDPDALDGMDERPPFDLDDTVALARVLREGQPVVMGVWGSDAVERRRTAVQLARDAKRPLLAVHDPRALTIDVLLGTAAARGAILWWDAEAVAIPDPVPLFLQRALSVLPSSVIIGRARPWRPLWLLASGRYLEHTLPRLDVDARERVWSEAFPDEPSTRHRALATQYEMGVTEIRAVGALAGRSRMLATNGHRPPLAPHLAAATAIVTRRETLHCATVVEPRRGPDDLVLEPRLYARVLEIAALHRAWVDVSKRWNLNRLVTGRGGLRFLFTGDSGTGKTLAAEVIASQLARPMLRVDLAQVVSKWVGETEKNLEAVFTEAETANAVLFFDEGDALFGKRSDVRHGTDRWANLEVSFMLQRLEEHPGLVILATNLRDNIDAAFVRRFQEVLHFPRPEAAERRRLWELALGARVPLSPEVDLDALTQFDLTGASIVDIARTAAMLAVIDGRSQVSLADVDEALLRDFNRHGRCYPTRRPDGMRIAGR